MNTTEYLHCDNCTTEHEIDWKDNRPVYVNGMLPSEVSKDGHTLTFDVTHEGCDTDRLTIILIDDGEGNGYILGRK